MVRKTKNLEHLDPTPDADLTPLEKIFWDYNITEPAHSLYDFVLGKKEIETLDRNRVVARMLTTVGWYDLVDIFGLKHLRCFLTDAVLQWIWPESLRNNYEHAGKVLERTLP